MTSGFSADQRVFGVSHRLPASLTSDDVMDPRSLAFDSRTDYQRAHGIGGYLGLLPLRCDIGATTGRECAVSRDRRGGERRLGVYPLEGFLRQYVA